MCLWQFPHLSLLPQVGKYALDRASTTPYGNKISLKMDACFIIYTPLNTLIWSLLSVGLNASEDNIKTLRKPIEANATPYQKGQCKS